MDRRALLLTVIAAGCCLGGCPVSDTGTSGLDPTNGGEFSGFASLPSVSPAVGVDSSGQVVLDAGISGEAGAITIEWAAADPNNIDPGITLPIDMTTESITLNVAAGVCGVFPFRVTATDSDGDTVAAIANVFLGIVDVTLDVKATRLQVNPVSSISLRTLRAGGLPDVDTTTNDTFTYTWQILDESNTDVTSTATISPASGATRDAAVNDWTITGLSTPGAYRLIATVEDKGGMWTTSSASVLLVEGLGLAVEASRVRVGADTGFKVRTARTGGEGSFTYTFLVLDSGGTNDTGSTAFTPDSGSSASAVSNDWLLTGFSAADTYRIFATVTDSAGDSSTASTQIEVGDVLGLDVRATSNLLAPGGTTTVTLDRTGGAAGFSYAISATGGSPSPSSPTSSNDSSTTYTAPGSPGAYVITATVTDALGATATDSTWVLVEAGGGSASPTLNISSSNQNFTIEPGDSTSLAFDVTGGTANYNYVYSASGPGGAGAFTTGSPQNGQAGDAGDVWTAPAAGAGVQGDYQITATVTDSTAATATDTIWIRVEPDQPLSLDVDANTYIVAPGATVTVSMDQTGGVAQYDYVYSASGPGGAGSFTTGSPQNNQAGDAADTWTAPTGGSAVGSYLITVTCTDELGNTVTDSIWVSVIPATALSLDVRADTYIVTPGGAVAVSMDETGGIGPHDYVYSATGPGGAGSFTTGSPQNNVAGDATDTWTAPTGGSAVGSYRITVTVTDDAGETFTDSIWVSVSPATALSLDVDAGTYVVTPNGAVVVSMDETGGIGPYDYVYSATGPGGAGSFTTGSPQNNVAGDTTDTWTAPAGGSAVGSYQISVTVTDDAGQTFTDSIWVAVEPAASLSLDVRAADSHIATGGSTVVTFDVTGGIGPYDYVYDNGGAGGAFTTGSPQNNVAGDSTDTWTAPGGAVSATITVTVTDDAGTTFTDSVTIEVQ